MSESDPSWPKKKTVQKAEMFLLPEHSVTKVHFNTKKRLILRMDRANTTGRIVTYPFVTVQVEYNLKREISFFFQ